MYSIKSLASKGRGWYHATVEFVDCYSSNWPSGQMGSFCLDVRLRFVANGERIPALQSKAANQLILDFLELPTSRVPVVANSPTDYDTYSTGAVLPSQGHSQCHIHIKYCSFRVI
jgi:hypothetical protein